jgi:predicted transcriptional regulator
LVKNIAIELPPLSSGAQPAYNTISTIVRILEDKGFVGHESQGRSHVYFPLVSKESYSNEFLNSFMGKYFGGSFQKKVSFFVEKNDIDVEGLEELSKYLKDPPKNEEK